MSQLHSDMLEAANLLKGNLIFAMGWDARNGRKGISEFTSALAGLANWIVQFQSNRIPKGQIFPQWLNVTTRAGQVYDEWYAKQGEHQS